MANITYRSEKLADFLREMADYLSDSCTKDEYPDYFQDIVETGLFHDAMGKPIAVTEDSVIVCTEY